MIAMYASPTKELNTMAIDFTEHNRLQEGIELVNELTPEELDQLIDHIRAVYKLNRQQQSLNAYSRISVGDRVKLVGNRKPQYLIGLTGKVVEKRNTRLLIELDGGPIGKFRSGKVLTGAAGLEVL